MKTIHDMQSSGRVTGSHGPLNWEAEVDDLVQSIAEWDDRTAPDDYPGHLLITPAELKEFARDVAALSPAR